MKQGLTRFIKRTPMYLPLRSSAGWLGVRRRWMALVLRRILVRVPFYFAFRSWDAVRRQKRELAEWEKKGRPAPPPHVVKEQTISKYAEKYGLKTLIETGTCYGDMVEAMRPAFSQIYSIELSEYLYKTAKRRFAGAKQITIINGDSGIELGNLVARIDTPVLFWLDGHYSEGETAQGQKDTPIYEELTHIFNSKHSGDVILIDDARCFGTYPSYPSMDDLFRFIKSKKPDAKIEVETDSIRITPR